MIVNNNSCERHTLVLRLALDTHVHLRCKVSPHSRLDKLLQTALLNRSFLTTNQIPSKIQRKEEQGFLQDIINNADSSHS